jgi:ribosomal protein S12 methylthiotransferase
MRGKHVSTPMEDLVKQAKGMAAKGTKELILIAQDLTYYGLDIYKKRNLSDLLKNLSDVEGIDWIRLQYAYPSGFPLDVLDVMAERSNICNYIDMPLQHASSDMLKLMRRGIDRPKTEDLIKTIRDKVPGIAFRTTMIIGHPGETEKDFDELCSFVEEQRFDRLGAFTYSHEEHTHSYSFEDTIPQEEKEERQATIMAIQEGISAELNEKKIGNTYKVLFDRKEGGYFIGRTEHDSPEVDNEVMVSAKDQYVRIGDFANVKINDAAEFDLFGEIVK